MGIDSYSADLPVIDNCNPDCFLPRQSMNIWNESNWCGVTVCRTYLRFFCDKDFVNNFNLESSTAGKWRTRFLSLLVILFRFLLRTFEATPPVLEIGDNSGCWLFQWFRLSCLRIQYCAYTGTSGYMDTVTKCGIWNWRRAEITSSLGVDDHGHVDNTYNGSCCRGSAIQDAYLDIYRDRISSRKIAE